MTNREKKGIASAVQAKAPESVTETIAADSPAPETTLIKPQAANLVPVEKKKAYVGTSREVIPLVPSDLDGAWRMAIIFATSGLLPKSYGTGEIDAMASKAFLAMQLGAEVGLSPMQAIQSIAIVNGQPSIWGDAMLGLVRKSGLMNEYSEKTYKEGDKKNWKAVSRARRGDEVVETTFTWQDAITAQLAGKPGTWQSHPGRMLLYKARAFTLRDLFSDVLKGLTHSVEEMEGENEIKGGKAAQSPKGTSGFASRVEPQEGTVIEGESIDVSEAEAEAPTEESWDCSINTNRGTRIETKVDHVNEGLATMHELLKAEKEKGARLNIINLNLPFIRALAGEKRMDDIQGLHKLAGEGE